MHTVWQLRLTVAGLVVLLLQLLGEGAAAATGSICGQSTRAVVPPLQGAFCASYLYTTKGSQGFPKVAAQGHACRCAAGEGFTGHVRSGWSERESFDDEESSVY